MRLDAEYTNYTDDGKVIYDTMATAPASLTLSFAGSLQSGANNSVIRMPGTTHITGTAVSDYGTYNVDLTR